jgi:cell division protein ZapA
MSDERTLVSVQIAGEEYNLRALASPEYTRECAAYVDQTLSQIMRQGTLLQVHKGAILAALSLADELFQTRRALDQLQSSVATRTDLLCETIESRLTPSDLAGGL